MCDCQTCQDETFADIREELGRDEADAIPRFYADDPEDNQDFMIALMEETLASWKRTSRPDDEVRARQFLWRLARELIEIDGDSQWVTGMLRRVGLRMNIRPSMIRKTLASAIDEAA